MTSRNRIAAGLVAAGIGLTGIVIAGSSADAATTVVAGRWTNCDHVHNYWPHGVGRRHAVDHTSGTPVTNFKHSNRLYRKAMNHNSGLDADKDKIACEAA
jgi:hypothetical protein